MKYEEFKNWIKSDFETFKIEEDSNYKKFLLKEKINDEMYLVYNCSSYKRDLTSQSYMYKTCLTNLKGDILFDIDDYYCPIDELKKIKEDIKEYKYNIKKQIKEKTLIYLNNKYNNEEIEYNDNIKNKAKELYYNQKQYEPEYEFGINIKTINDIYEIYYNTENFINKNVQQKIELNESEFLYDFKLKKAMNDIKSTENKDFEEFKIGILNAFNSDKKTIKITFNLLGEIIPNEPVLINKYTKEDIIKKDLINIYPIKTVEKILWGRKVLFDKNNYIFKPDNEKIRLKLIENGFFEKIKNEESLNPDFVIDLLKKNSSYMSKINKKLLNDKIFIERLDSELKYNSRFILELIVDVPLFKDFEYIKDKLEKLSEYDKNRILENNEICDVLKNDKEFCLLFLETLNRQKLFVNYIEPEDIGTKLLNNFISKYGKLENLSNEIINKNKNINELKKYFSKNEISRKLIQLNYKSINIEELIGYVTNESFNCKNLFLNNNELNDYIMMNYPFYYSDLSKIITNELMAESFLIANDINKNDKYKMFELLSYNSLFAKKISEELLNDYIKSDLKNINTISLINNEIIVETNFTKYLINNSAYSKYLYIEAIGNENNSNVKFYEKNYNIFLESIKEYYQAFGITINNEQELRDYLKQNIIKNEEIAK